MKQKTMHKKKLTKSVTRLIIVKDKTTKGLVVKVSSKYKNHAKKTKEQESIITLLIKSCVLCYMTTMALVFPFFITDGYANVGSDKNMFFRYAALVFCGVSMALGLLYVLIYFKKIDWKTCIKDTSITDKFALMYGVVVILSYFFTQYKETAYWGRKGWYVGLITQLLYLAIYFFISRFYIGGDTMQYPYIASTIVVFGIGILNRFSIYPFDLKGKSSGFISTLGNINWFCSYWSVLFPIAAVLLLYKGNDKIRKKILYIVIYSIMAVAGAIQGSDSGGIVFAAVFLVLFWKSTRSIAELRNYFRMVTLTMALFQLVRLVRHLAPEAMNMQTTITEILTQGNLTLIGFIVAAVLCGLCFLFEKKEQKRFLIVWKWIRNIAFVLIALVVIVYVVLVCVNTWGNNYIEGISDKEIFKFDWYFGNGRGATWRAGIALFGEMSVLQKLIGIGPDCFAEFAYREGSGIIGMLREVFGDATLTNAHNEWLTNLVNLGLLGFVSFAGIFITAIRRFVKKGVENPWLYACGLATLCYTAHNMVSFQQALNAPIMFMVLAIGENLMRKENK